MPKYLFVIHDDGEYKRITATTVRDDSFQVDPKLYYETDSLDLFNSVQELLKDGEVKYPSNWAGKLKIDNLIQTKYDALELKRLEYYNRAKLLLNQRIDVISLFEVITFIVLNNYLMDKGYFITDENREQKYLEIIETQDEEIISKLEEYLECRDQLSNTNYIYSHFQKFSKAIASATSVDEIEVAFTSFNSIFH